MRSLLIGILLSSTTVLAQPAAPVAPRGNGLSAIAVADVPDQCRDLAKLADSRSPNQALSARISLASCLIEARMKPLVLCDCEQSVRDLDAAAIQSMPLLDEVAQVGDPAMKILALQAKGDLVSGFATRILATVPAAIDNTEAALTLHDTRLSLITPLVAPWQQQARGAYQQIDELARTNPQLAKNPAVLSAVRASRAKLASDAGVAKR